MNFDTFLLSCSLYRDYLNHFIDSNDVRNLNSVNVAYDVAKLGYRSRTKILTETEFKALREGARDRLNPIRRALTPYSSGIKIQDRVLSEIAWRESFNNQKILSTIIFVTYVNKTGFRKSGYIDFADALMKSQAGENHSRDFRKIFLGLEYLRPRPTDLSYYNWHKNFTSYNNSSNYLVQKDPKYGLIFLHKGDHKKICAGTDVSQDERNANRYMFFSKIYGHVVFYDHTIRKKI